MTKQLTTTLDQFRQQFEVLTHHPELVYLDSANTTLKPQCILKAISQYYQNHVGNVGRGNSEWSQWVNHQHYLAHQMAGQQIGVNAQDIVLTASSTYALNMVAHGIADQLQVGDIILLSLHEHNSNIIPWLALAKKTGAVVKYVDQINQADLAKVKIFSYSQVANLTGQIYDYATIAKNIRRLGGLVCLDSTQAINHPELVAQALAIPAYKLPHLEADFLVYSAHKIYGPTGVGVLYVNPTIRHLLKPLVYGSQTFSCINNYSYKLLTSITRFEPGTPNIEGEIGLIQGLRLFNSLPANIRLRHELDLGQRYHQQLASHGLTDYQVRQPVDLAKPRQVPIFSLAHPQFHPHDIAMLLDQQHIVVRTGKSCADILLNSLGQARGVIRVSPGLYNTKSDIDKFMLAYQQAVDTLGGKR